MYYTMKQMAELFGVTEHTLRYYTDEGLLPCRRDGGNRRVFNEESVNWMQGILCLKGCGASIEDIRAYCAFACWRDRRRTCGQGMPSFLSSGKKPINGWRRQKPRRNIWTARRRTTKQFWQVLLRTTPTPKTGRQKTARHTIEQESREVFTLRAAGSAGAGKYYKGGLSHGSGKNEKRSGRRRAWRG